MTDDGYVLYLPDQGGWLAEYDPDGGDPKVAYPTGTYAVTSELAHALRFPDAAGALACWQRQSLRTPLRPDGKPNRPLSALTVVVQPTPVEVRICQ
jgi:hypothetical protein